MSIANFAAYQDRLQGLYQKVRFSKSAITTVAARTYSSWLSGGFPAAGAAPTTAAVPTNATAGSLRQIDCSGSTQRILRLILQTAGATGGMITIADRLSHQGGLSGTATGAQTTNLPTSALTRYTGGDDVLLGLEIYTAIGATGTTVSASYTNQANTSGRTTPLTTWGGTGFNAASRFIPLPFQVGDSGVRAVASVTNTATTGTVGAFGVTLAYPLLSLPIDDVTAPMGIDEESLFGFGTWFPQVVDGACLFAIIHMVGTTTGIMQGQALLSED